MSQLEARITVLENTRPTRANHLFRLWAKYCDCYMIPKVHGGDWQAGGDRIYRELEADADDADLLITFFDLLLDGTYQEKCREIRLQESKVSFSELTCDGSETFVNFEL